MAIINLPNITSRGTLATFRNAMLTAQNVWQQHTQTMPSTAGDENYIWMGMVPVPREKLTGRDFQDMIDFAFTVPNITYEMSFRFQRETMEDDQHGLLGNKVTEAANSYADYYDNRFGALLIAGENDNAFDGTSFHADTRTIGDSANIDNSLTANIDPTNAPDLTEIQDALKECIETMSRFEDDKGRPGYSTRAMSKIRVVVPPEYHRIFTEAVNSDLIGGGGATTPTPQSNPFFKNIVEIDVLSHLTDADDAFYFNAVGDPTRQPFIYQERTKLEVEVFGSGPDVAENDGLMVLSRQRFKFTYGEPRFSIRYDFT